VIFLGVLGCDVVVKWAVSQGLGLSQYHSFGLYVLLL